MTAGIIKQEVLKTADSGKMEQYLRFFKCFPGGYGYGDTFAGIRNPDLRKAARTWKHVSINEVALLLTDPVHEIRLLALFIMELKYKSKVTSDYDRNQLASLYLENLQYINNWDLVDASAPFILGPWTFKNGSEQLFRLAYADNLWNNRVAMLACFYFIRNQSFEVPLKIAELLLPHKHDLIHKAVGWMLREIGKRDVAVEMAFLKTHYKNIPRTALRYAIEKFEKPLQSQIRKGQFV